MDYGHFAILNLWIRQWSKGNAPALMEIIFLQVLILKLNEGTTGNWESVMPAKGSSFFY